MTLTRITSDGITDGTVVNADINASAAIDVSKLSGVLPLAGGTLTGNVTYDNDVKAIFGTGGSAGLLEIKANANGGSVITEKGGGDLTIQSTENGVFFQHAGTSEYLATMKTDAEVELYHNGVQKFETSSTGVTVSGNIVVSGTVDGVDIAARNTLFGGLTSSSGVLTNGVTATTQSASDNSTKVATTAYTDTAISNLVDSSPSTLNTLNELAAALGDDANFSTTVTNSLATKLANIVEDTSPQLGGNLSTNGNNINFGDSSGTGDDRATFGAAGDLQIYHDGTDSYILENGAGVLNIKTNGVSIDLTKTPHESLARFIVDGAVELYHNNSKKFETDTNGITVTGRVLASGTSNIGFAGLDNVKLSLGTSDDLQIYHDGTHSRIYNSTGNLICRSAGYYFNNAAGTENMLDIVQNGAVSLYYDNTKRFETTSSGADVTGRLMTDGVFIGDGGNNDTSLSIGANNDLRLYHDGSNSHILDRGTGSLLIKSDAVNLGSESGEYYFRGFEGGGVQLRYDNSTKLETVTGGVYVYGDLLFGVGTTGHLYGGDNDKVILGSGSDFQIYHDSVNSYIANLTGGLRISVAGGSNQVQINKGTVDENMARFIADGAVELYHNNVKKFETRSGGVTVQGQLSVANTASGGVSLSVPDNVKAAFGTSDDLIIFHDGNNGNSHIKESGGGSLVLNADDLYLQNAAGTENLAVFVEDGAVELYHNGTKMIETTSTGTSIPDGKFAKFGASDDMAMGHNTYNYITYSGADFLITGDNTNHVKIMPRSDESAAVFKPNAEVELYYDNSKKFETTSAGATISGALTLTSHLVMGASDEIKLGGSSQMTIWHTGSDFNMYNNAGQLIISNASGTGVGEGAIVFKSGNNNTRWYIGSGGHFYPSTNNTFDIGTSTYRVRNIYTNDLNLSNEGSSNDVDGTWGSYTIQEGAEDLFLVNKRNGKKYKFNLTEVS